MPLFELKSLSQTCVLENATDDYRSARKVGQFRIGEKAAYLPGFPGTRYVPYDAVSHAWTKKTSITVKGCCGKALPMVRFRMFYDGEFYQDFMFDKLEDANTALDILRAARPDIPLEREGAEWRAVGEKHRWELPNGVFLRTYF